MAKPRKKVNGYKMPDPLPSGIVLEDVSKKKWKLGTSIGKGGFGEIYSADVYTEAPKKNTKYPYVIKIEPHENGPLFVEMHFYTRNAKPDDIASFQKENKMSTLGMPAYLGSGSHEHNGVKYRFLVMEKFGVDIWNLFLESSRTFPAATVFKIAVQILDVLEYIHSRGYVHADIKGSNILLGASKETQNQVYLVDFGLAAHYSTNKDFKPDPKKAHDGTIEYLSRDAHLGVQTRRGDLEILGYNIIQWLGCTLPWEKDISDPSVVQQSKEKYMADIPDFLKTCFKNKAAPDAVKSFLKYLTTLKFDTEPDYHKIRKILLSAIEAAGGTLKSPLHFKATKSPGKHKLKEEGDGVLEEAEVKIKKKRGSRKHEVPEDRAEKVVKKTGKKHAKLDKHSEESGEDPAAEEDINPNVSEDENVAAKVTKKRGPKAKDDDHEEETETGYTAEMLRIKNKIKSVKEVKTTKSKGKRNYIKDIAEKAANIALNDIDSTPSTSNGVVPPSFVDGTGRPQRHRKAVNYIEDITPKKFYKKKKN